MCLSLMSVVALVLLWLDLRGGNFLSFSARGPDFGDGALFLL